MLPVYLPFVGSTRYYSLLHQYSALIVYIFVLFCFAFTFHAAFFPTTEIESVPRFFVPTSRADAVTSEPKQVNKQFETWGMFWVFSTKNKQISILNYKSILTWYVWSSVYCCVLWRQLKSNVNYIWVLWRVGLLLPSMGIIFQPFGFALLFWIYTAFRPWSTKLT